jgi:P27 family predicted phage terminase small subunit
MGARGPAPTPTTILKARGNPHAKKRAEIEPQDEIAAPAMPSGLPKEAQDHWRWIVPRLVARGTLAEADLGMLAAMCVEWADYIGAVRTLEKLRASRSKFAGHMIDHPRVIKNSAYDRYKQAADRFGLSPSAKSRVQATPAEKKPAVPAAEAPKLRIAQ